ncbi:zinc finger domain-containing protein [Pontibacter liquoris]|uniref:zinc finger domain-containing protein n=1 Tax=Pontibacter liquoris TaxID=2905677 RepID=UPI003F5AB9B0
MAYTTVSCTNCRAAPGTSCGWLLKGRKPRLSHSSNRFILAPHRLWQRFFPCAPGATAMALASV